MDVSQIASGLRQARAKVGMSRKDAAKAVGASERTLYAWEKGEAMPPLDRAVRLAETYGMMLSELVGDRDIEGVRIGLDALSKRINELDERIRQQEAE